MKRLLILLILFSSLVIAPVDIGNTDTNTGQDFTQLNYQDQIAALQQNPQLINQYPEFAQKYYSDISNVGKVPEADLEYFKNPQNVLKQQQAATEFFQTATVENIRQAKDGAKALFEKIYPRVVFDFGVIEDNFKWDEAKGILSNGQKEFTGLNALKTTRDLRDDLQVTGIEVITDGLRITYKNGKTITIDGKGAIKAGLGDKGLVVEKNGKKYILNHDTNAKIKVDGDTVFLQNFKLVRGESVLGNFRFSGDLKISPTEITSDGGNIQFPNFRVIGTFDINLKTKEVNLYDNHGASTFISTDPKKRLPGAESHLVMIKSGGQAKSKGEKLTIHLTGFPKNLQSIKGEHVFIQGDGLTTRVALKGRGSIVPIRQSEGGITRIQDRSVITGKNLNSFVTAKYRQSGEDITGGGQVQLRKPSLIIDFNDDNVRFNKGYTRNAETLELSCKGCSNTIGKIQKTLRVNGDLVRIPVKLVTDGDTIKTIIDPRIAGKLQGDIQGTNLIILNEGEDKGVGIINGLLISQEGSTRTQQRGISSQAGRRKLTAEQTTAVQRFEALRKANDIAGLKALANQLDPETKRLILQATRIDLDALNNNPQYAAKIAEHFKRIDRPKYGAKAWAAKIQQGLARRGIQITFDQNGNCADTACNTALDKAYRRRDAVSHQIIALRTAQAKSLVALAEAEIALGGGEGGKVRKLKQLVRSLQSTRKNWNQRYTARKEAAADKELAFYMEQERLLQQERQQYKQEADVKDRAVYDQYMQQEEYRQQEAGVYQAQAEAKEKAIAEIKDPESGMTTEEKRDYRIKQNQAAALGERYVTAKRDLKLQNRGVKAIEDRLARWKLQLAKANQEFFTDNDEPERQITKARNDLRRIKITQRNAQGAVASLDDSINTLAAQFTNPRAQGHVYTAAGKEREAARSYAVASATLKQLGTEDQVLQKNLFASTHRSIDPNSAQAVQKYRDAAKIAETITDPDIKRTADYTVRFHSQIKPVMNALIDKENEWARADLNSQDWSYGSGDFFDTIFDYSSPIGEGIGHFFVETISLGENYKDWNDFEDVSDADQAKTAFDQTVALARNLRELQDGKDIKDVQFNKGFQAQGVIWKKQADPKSAPITAAEQDAVSLEIMNNKIEVAGLDGASGLIKQTQTQLKTADAVAANAVLFNRVIDIQATATKFDIGQAVVEIAASFGTIGLAKAAARTGATQFIKTFAKVAKYTEALIDIPFTGSILVGGKVIKILRPVASLLPSPGVVDDLFSGAAARVLPEPKLDAASALTYDIVRADTGTTIRAVVSPDRKVVQLFEVDPIAGTSRRVDPGESSFMKGIAEEAKVSAQPYTPSTLQAGRARNLDEALDNTVPTQARVLTEGTKEAPINTFVWPNGQVQKVEAFANGNLKRVTTVQPDGRSVIIKEYNEAGIQTVKRTAKPAEQADAAANAILIRAKASDLPIAQVDNVAPNLNRALSPAQRTSSEALQTAAQILDNPGLRRSADPTALATLDELVESGISLSTLAGRSTDPKLIREALESIAKDLPAPKPGKTEIKRLGKKGVEIIKTDAQGKIVKTIKLDGNKIEIKAFGADGKVVSEVSDDIRRLADVTDDGIKYADDIAQDVQSISTARQLLASSDNTFRHELGTLIERTPFIRAFSTRLTKIDKAITSAKAELKQALASGDEAAINVANIKVNNLEVGYQAGVSSRGRLLHSIIRPRALDPDKRRLIKVAATKYDDALKSFETAFTSSGDEISLFILKNPEFTKNIENTRGAYLSSVSAFSRRADVDFNFDSRLNRDSVDAFGAPSDLHRGTQGLAIKTEVDVRVSSNIDVGLVDARAALHQEVSLADELGASIPVVGYKGVTDVGGRPGVVTEVVEGTKFTGNPASLTDNQIKELGEEGIEQLSKHMETAAEAGWAANRVSFVKLSSAQKINGVKYAKGDIVFTDVHSWQAVGKSADTEKLLANNKILVNQLSDRLANVGKAPPPRVADEVIDTFDDIVSPSRQLDDGTITITDDDIISSLPLGTDDIVSAKILPEGTVDDVIEITDADILESIKLKDELPSELTDPAFLKELEEFKVFDPDKLAEIGDDIKFVVNGDRPISLTPAGLINNQIALDPAYAKALESGQLIRKDITFKIGDSEVTMVAIYRADSKVGAKAAENLEDIYSSGRSLTAQGDREIGKILRYDPKKVEEYIELLHPGQGLKVDDAVNIPAPLRDTNDIIPPKIGTRDDYDSLGSIYDVEGSAQSLENIAALSDDFGFESIVRDKDGRVFFVTIKGVRENYLAKSIGDLLAAKQGNLDNILRIPEMRKADFGDGEVLLMEYVRNTKELASVDDIAKEAGTFALAENIWWRNWDFKDEHILVTANGKANLIDLEMAFGGKKDADFWRTIEGNSLNQKELNQFASRPNSFYQSTSFKDYQNTIATIKSLGENDFAKIHRLARESGYTELEALQVVNTLRRNAKTIEKDLEYVINKAGGNFRPAAELVNSKIIREDALGPLVRVDDAVNIPAPLRDVSAPKIKADTDILESIKLKDELPSKLISERRIAAAALNSKAVDIDLGGNLGIQLNEWLKTDIGKAWLNKEGKAWYAQHKKPFYKKFPPWKKEVDLASIGDELPILFVRSKGLDPLKINGFRKNRENIENLIYGPETVESFKDFGVGPEAYYERYLNKNLGRLEEGNLEQKVLTQRTYAEAFPPLEGFVGVNHPTFPHQPPERLSRFYFNAKGSDEALEISERVVAKMQEHGIIYQLKTVSNKAAFANRVDNTVLYVPLKDVEKVEKIISELNLGRLVDPEVPLLTKKLGNGIARADGIVSSSAGQLRAKALDDIRIRVDGRELNEERLVAIWDDVMRKHGINPDQPWKLLDDGIIDSIPIARVDAQGTDFIVKPFVEGKTADELLLAQGGKLTDNQIDDLARVYHKARENGIDLDMQPEKIIWNNGQWVIIDGAIGNKLKPKTVRDRFFKKNKHYNAANDKLGFTRFEDRLRQLDDQITDNHVRTKHWLKTDEGKAWLKTNKGKSWQEQHRKGFIARLFSNEEYKFAEMGNDIPLQVRRSGSEARQIFYEHDIESFIEIISPNGVPFAEGRYAGEDAITIFLKNSDGFTFSVPKELASKVIVNGRPEAMSKLLNNPNVEGGKIINSIENVFPELKPLYDADAGVGEGYSIREHTERVLDVYNGEAPNVLPWISEYSDLNIDRLMRITLALHDIGKPKAIAAGNVLLQHDFTLPILKDTLEKLRFNNREVILAQNLVNHDLLGDLSKGIITTDEAFTALLLKAKEIDITLDEFYKLQRLFFTSDAGSYPFVRNLAFEEYQGPAGLALNPKAQSFRDLEALIHTHTKPPPPPDPLDIFPRFDQQLQTAALESENVAELFTRQAGKESILGGVVKSIDIIDVPSRKSGFEVPFNLQHDTLAGALERIRYSQDLPAESPGGILYRQIRVDSPQTFSRQSLEEIIDNIDAMVDIDFLHGTTARTLANLGETTRRTGNPSLLPHGALDEIGLTAATGELGIGIRVVDSFDGVNVGGLSGIDFTAGNVDTVYHYARINGGYDLSLTRERIIRMERALERGEPTQVAYQLELDYNIFDTSLLEGSAIETAQRELRRDYEVFARVTQMNGDELELFTEGFPVLVGTNSRGREVEFNSNIWIRGEARLEGGINVNDADSIIYVERANIPDVKRYLNNIGATDARVMSIESYDVLNTLTDIYVHRRSDGVLLTPEQFRNALATDPETRRQVRDNIQAYLDVLEDGPVANLIDQPAIPVTVN